MKKQLIDTKKLLQPDPFTDIYGQAKAKHSLKSALLVGRHVILIGNPGIGKTTLAKNVAKLLPDISSEEYHAVRNTTTPDPKKIISGEERFIRIQGSPDLSVEDLLGDIDPSKALKYGPLSIEAFTPGKIFLAHKGILFFDEINRCSEKLQNALLQILEEGYATIGSYTVDFPADFIFIGTMNPNDTSTEKLSDVFLDRCDVIVIQYPETLEIEKKIVMEKSTKVEGVHFPDSLLHHTIQFVRDLRDHDSVEKKPSVRASLGLYERASANARIKNKSTVSFEDVEEAMLSVLSHRMELKPSVKYLQKAEDFIRQELKEFIERHKHVLDSEQGGEG